MRFHDDVFSRSLQKSLNELRICGSACDVTILVSGEEFKAHRSVLSAASPYFRTMFNTRSSFKESKEDKITLNEVDRDAVSSILKFIYTSSIEITERNIYPLIETCNLLQVDGLRVWINLYLQKTISTDNCLSLYVISKRYDYHDLAESTFHYILQNFSQVAESDEFLQISIDILLDVLSSKFLNVIDEKSLFQYVLRWVKADLSSRKDYVDELVNKIELKNIPVSALIELKNEELFRESLYKKLEVLDKNQVEGKCDITEGYNKHDFWERFRYGAEQEIILAVGGETDGEVDRDVECYTSGYEMWKFSIPQYVQSSNGFNVAIIPTMKWARQNAAVAQDSRHVYVLGGRNSTHVLDKCEVYDVKRNRWKCLDDAPSELEGSGAVVFEGRLIIVGGRNDSGSTNQAWEWDEKNRQWKDFPPLTCSRSFHGTVVVAGLIFAVGGFENDSETAVRTVERYDPNLKKWLEVHSMHEARARFGCTVVDNYIYVIGGINEFYGLKSVERYDLKTNEWSFMEPMTVPRHSFSVAVYENRINCIGGSDTVNILNNVERFNPRTNRWHYVLPMQKKRLGLVSATVLVPVLSLKEGY